MAHRLFVLALLMLLACRSDKKESPRNVDPLPAPAAPAATESHTDDVATFWKWFTANAAALHSEQDLRQIMERISTELAKVNPGVFAEIGKDGDQLMLVLSADGNKELFPIVKEVYAKRPTVEGWKIVAFRQRDTRFATIELGDRKLDPKQIKFVATPAGSKLDIQVYMPGFTTKDEMGQIGFVILDHVVGEYDMETKIGGIEFASAKEAPATAKSLPELPAVVDALK